MSKFKKYIQRLENKRTSPEIGTLVTLKHSYWGDHVMYGEIQEIRSDRVVCGISHLDFNREHVKGSPLVDNYVIFTKISKEYEGNNSIRIFLTETGQEVSKETLADG